MAMQVEVPTRRPAVVVEGRARPAEPRPGLIDRRAAAVDSLLGGIDSAGAQPSVAREQSPAGRNPAGSQLRARRRPAAVLDNLRQPDASRPPDAAHVDVTFAE
jgi:hypothetical protein